jgi:hypothetical protein
MIGRHSPTGRVRLEFNLLTAVSPGPFHPYQANLLIINMAAKVHRNLSGAASLAG